MSADPEVESKHKTCQYCGEEILSVAIKCKHCQSNLKQAESTPTSIATEAHLGEGGDSRKRIFAILLDAGAMIVFVFFAGALFARIDPSVWTWRNPNYDYAGDRLFQLAVLFALWFFILNNTIATALWGSSIGKTLAGVRLGIPEKPLRYYAFLAARPIGLFVAYLMATEIWPFRNYWFLVWSAINGSILQTKVGDHYWSIYIIIVITAAACIGLLLSGKSQAISRTLFGKFDSTPMRPTKAAICVSIALVALIGFVHTTTVARVYDQAVFWKDFELQSSLERLGAHK